LWPELFFSAHSIILHDVRNACSFLEELLLCNRTITLNGWELWLFVIVFSVLGDQYIFEYLPIHRGIISPNFFVPAYICQLYNPFITRKSFGKLQIKAGIIKGFLLKHAFFEAPTYNALLPL
jgi:hypothetical protein